MTDHSRNLERLLARARRSNGPDFDLPIIDGYDEAAAMARDIAARLACLPWSERALLISDLEMLEKALQTRANVLRANMSAHAAEIVSLTRGANVRHAYAAGKRLGRMKPVADA